MGDIVLLIIVIIAAYKNTDIPTTVSILRSTNAAVGIFGAADIFPVTCAFVNIGCESFTNFICCSCSCSSSHGNGLATVRFIIVVAFVVPHFSHILVNTILVVICSSH